MLDMAAGCSYIAHIVRASCTTASTALRALTSSGCRSLQLGSSDNISDACSRAQPLDDTGLDIPALNVRGNSKKATLGHNSKMADLDEQVTREEQGHLARGNLAHRQ